MWSSSGDGQSPAALCPTYLMLHVQVSTCVFGASLQVSCLCVDGELVGYSNSAFTPYLCGKFMVQQKVGVLLFHWFWAMLFHPIPSPSHSTQSGENSGSSEEFLKRRFMFALHILFRLYKYLCFMRCISSILITVFCRLLGAVMGNPRRLSFATSTSSRKIVHAKR